MSHNQLATDEEEQMNHNKIADMLNLKVTEAHTSKDVGKGIARIDYNVMLSLGVQIGNIIEIPGKKKDTVARSIPLESARLINMLHICKSN